MKAEESKLTSVFADNKTFEIPRYQRPYSWSESNTYDLINDVYEAFENSESEYFIGSIITIAKNNDTTFEIVDGQQRLTTLTIIFAKLRDLISAVDAKNEIQKRILPINALTDTQETPRLLVREQDRSFFEKYILLGKHLEDKTDISETQLRFINNSAIVQEYFENKNCDERTLKLFANYLLGSVYVVYVKTESFQSAYRLFNVLNARGLPLSNADLIKNKLFDKTPEEHLQDSIEEKWNELEDIITISNLDVFLSHHRTSLKGEKQQSVLHKEFEEYLKTYPGNAIQFLDETIKSAKNYKKIIKNEFEDVSIRRIIASLQNVSHDEWVPPLLSFMNSPVVNLSLGTFIKYIDKITYQGWIRRLGKTQRNTVYYNVINLINNNASAADVINKIKEFKNNEEFKTFIEGNIYGNQYATPVLLRIEQEMQDLSVTKTYEGTISIEHILPQKIAIDFWRQRFTDDEHKNYVHKIGNLTLLSGRKNSAANNYDFSKKKDAYDKKNLKVSFDMTKEVCTLKDWTIETLTQRQQQLVNKVEEIWYID
ncbi:MAG: DUF262 domain-containing protein [Bacteroidota bacterium]